ncbi:MAG TPA: hypothetical protein VGF24_25515 [Vicinamibacterales bacterium]
MAIAAVLGIVSTSTAQVFPQPKQDHLFPAPQIVPPVPGPDQRKQPPPPQLTPNDRQREEALRTLREEARSRLQGSTPKVVCGMTVIPASPALDPNSVKPAPRDKKYTMRSVPPPMCGGADNTLPAPDGTPTGPTPNPPQAR